MRIEIDCDDDNVDDEYDETINAAAAAAVCYAVINFIYVNRRASTVHFYDADVTGIQRNPQYTHTVYNRCIYELLIMHCLSQF